MGSRHEFGGGDTAPAINLHLQQVALALYGILPQIHRLHSENSYVCSLHFGHGRDDWTARARVRRPAGTQT